MTIFEFVFRYDRLFQEFEYLTHLELQSVPSDANRGHLDFLPPAADLGLLTEWVFPDEEADDGSESESSLLGDLTDWYPAPEHEYESESEYESGKEDLPQVSQVRPAFAQHGFAHSRKIFSVGHRGLARFSKCRFEESAWED